MLGVLPPLVCDGCNDRDDVDDDDDDQHTVDGRPSLVPPLLVTSNGGEVGEQSSMLKNGKIFVAKNGNAA